MASRCRVTARPRRPPAPKVRWGINVAQAAHAAGIEHFVFPSVAGADRHGSETLPRNLISKWHIEQHIAKLHLPATILRPVSFMENSTGGYALQGGVDHCPRTKGSSTVHGRGRRRCRHLPGVLPA
ncbi:MULTISPECIES: NmrA family NAD(P)-binding protein [Streptomyces]|uniref:NmrA family NAD(P)-binding protein n=1 Tax=Streptomyces flaveolus TaxID=67297 RepID=A0ABV3AQ76_9ACTN